MKIGDVYAAPWGRYVVHRLEPKVVLRSLDRVSAYVVNPSFEVYRPTGELVESDKGPRLADSPNGLFRGGEGRPAAAAGEVPARTMGDTTIPSTTTAQTDLPKNMAASGEVVAAASSGNSPGDPVSRGGDDLEGPWRPGLSKGGLRLMWTPCFERTRDDAGNRTIQNHAWFIYDGTSLYCESCRASRPRTVMGPRARIAEIRAALERGDRARVDELVRALTDPSVVMTFPAGGEVDPSPEFSGAGACGDGSSPRTVSSPEPRATTPADAPVTVKTVEDPHPSGPASFGISEDVKTATADFERVASVYSYVPANRRAWDEEFIERAAILEYMANMPRAAAESQTRAWLGSRP